MDLVYKTLARIRKIDKDFVIEVDFKDIKSPVKIRDIHQVENKDCIIVSFFRYENVYISKNTFKTHVDLLLKEEEEQCHYDLFKDFSTLMYN